MSRSLLLFRPESLARLGRKKGGGRNKEAEKISRSNERKACGRSSERGREDNFLWERERTDKHEFRHAQVISLECINCKRKYKIQVMKCKVE